MTFLSVAAAFAAYVFVGLLFCLTVLAAVINWHGQLPLLDGSPLGSDDRERTRHIADAGLAEDAQVAALDAVWDLPARSHP